MESNGGFILNALARVAHDMRVAEMPTGERAYEHLKQSAEEGTELHMATHDLVLALSRALWNRDLGLVQIGLTELETRTSLAAVQERNAA